MSPGRLGVEPQCRERRAQPVRQVRHPLTLGGSQLVDAVGQQVERAGGVGQLGCRARMRPGVGRAGRQRSGGRRQAGGVTRHRSGQAVRDERRRRHQRHRHARQGGPGRRHSVVEQAPGHPRPGHRHVGISGPRDHHRVQLPAAVAILAERTPLAARQGERLVVVRGGIAEPGPVGEPHGHAPVRPGARPGDGVLDDRGFLGGEGQDRREGAEVALGRAQRPVTGHGTDQRPQRHRERHDDQAGRRHDHEQEPAPHAPQGVDGAARSPSSGLSSFTPTPRTVYR
jgi:hypothetical protein